MPTAHKIKEHELTAIVAAILIGRRGTGSEIDEYDAEVAVTSAKTLIKEAKKQTR